MLENCWKTARKLLEIDRKRLETARTDNTVVHYDSKWYTKFHKDCILEKKLSFKTSFDNNKLFQNVWPAAFATVQNELDHAVDYHSLYHSK